MHLITNDISPENCASYVTVLCYIFQVWKANIKTIHNVIK